MKNIIQSLRVYVVFTVLLGLVYPVAVTVIAQVSLPCQSEGSLIHRDGVVVGSRLIGQSFTELKYFQSRPSANNYDGTNSAPKTWAQPVKN